MKRKRFTPEKIMRMLREAEVSLSQGLTVGKICRRLEISEQTYYRRKLSGPTSSGLQPNMAVTVTDE